jgi:hypothetical protein
MPSAAVDKQQAALEARTDASSESEYAIQLVTATKGRKAKCKGK